jgi:hypothetical protein
MFPDGAVKVTSDYLAPSLFDMTPCGGGQGKL